MLITRNINMIVEAISSAEQTYRVVFDYDAGNLNDWDKWDEPPAHPHIEIVDVLDIGVDKEHIHFVSVYNFLSYDEEMEIVDEMFSRLGDEA